MTWRSSSGTTASCWIQASSPASVQALEEKIADAPVRGAEASGCGSAAIAVRWRMARAAENATAGAAVPAAAGGRTCQMPSPTSATTTTAVSTAA